MDDDVSVTMRLFLTGLGEIGVLPTSTLDMCAQCRPWVAPSTLIICSTLGSTHPLNAGVSEACVAPLGIVNRGGVMRTEGWMCAAALSAVLLSVGCGDDGASRKRSG